MTSNELGVRVTPGPGWVETRNKNTPRPQGTRNKTAHLPRGGFRLYAAHVLELTGIPRSTDGTRASHNDSTPFTNSDPNALMRMISIVLARSGKADVAPGSAFCSVVGFLPACIPHLEDDAFKMINHDCD